MINYSELFDLDNVVFTPHTFVCLSFQPIALLIVRSNLCSGATTMEVTRDSTIKAVEVCAQHLNGDIVEVRHC